mgnify:FL=1
MLCFEHQPFGTREQRHCNHLRCGRQPHPQRRQLITTDARLDSLYQTLPEVMITGERPIVKAAQGKLVYDLPRLIRNLPVDNAYDAVKELPGVIEMNGGLQLAGQGVTVILDGKVTTLSTEQLYSLLRSSLPAA